MEPGLSWIAKATGAKQVERGERIQALWGGYGEIFRVLLTGGDVKTAIVKWVRPPARPPRAERAVSHARKCRLYEVEERFCRAFAPLCDERPGRASGRATPRVASRSCSSRIWKPRGHRGAGATPMAGFDRDGAATVAAVPADHAIQCMVAVGHPGRRDELPERLRELEQPNQRTPTAELVSRSGFRREPALVDLPRLARRRRRGHAARRSRAARANEVARDRHDDCRDRALSGLARRADRPATPRARSVTSAQIETLPVREACERTLVLLDDRGVRGCVLKHGLAWKTRAGRVARRCSETTCRSRALEKRYALRLAERKAQTAEAEPARGFSAVLRETRVSRVGAVGGRDASPRPTEWGQRVLGARPGLWTEAGVDLTLKL